MESVDKNAGSMNDGAHRPLDQLRFVRRSGFARPHGANCPPAANTWKWNDEQFPASAVAPDKSVLEHGAFQAGRQEPPRRRPWNGDAPLALFLEGTILHRAGSVGERKFK